MIRLDGSTGTDAYGSRGCVVDYSPLRPLRYSALSLLTNRFSSRLADSIPG